MALYLTVLFKGSGRDERVVKSRKEELLDMPEVLLNTVDMMVRASVPPKGKETAIKEITVAM